MMQFLTDQDVYQSTINYLESLGHQVVRVKDIGLAKAADAEILRYAFQNQQILVTRDKDFGALTFVTHINSFGIILLRITPDTINSVHEELSRFLNEHTKSELKILLLSLNPAAIVLELQCKTNCDWAAAHGCLYNISPSPCPLPQGERE